MELPSEVKRPKPGQFFMIKVGRNNDPLLRRPLSIHRLISADTVQILYRVRGKGTRVLSKRVLGERLDILGPLGKGFEIPSQINEAILVAGGVGIAPLFPLAEELKRAGKSIKLFIGGKNREDILCEDDFRSLGLEIYISTEDGSYGKGGLVTDILEDYIQTPDSRLQTQMYACGPKLMLKVVSEIARFYSLPCYVSLEERMACGIGACLGCAVKTRVQSSELRVKGKNSRLRTPDSRLYRLVCKDGPVFNAEEIDWDG
ncbi:MAG: dihydroorotate dehydrogenase electron transfer subunit [Nitrospirae bacterium]|nr:dihydroorotate dehydrogenase electron transfer subunit [Nitrospirota bacterium]